jgi:hypothetical protein
MNILFAAMLLFSACHADTASWVDVGNIEYSSTDVTTYDGWTIMGVSHYAKSNGTHNLVFDKINTDTWRIKTDFPLFENRDATYSPSSQRGNDATYVDAGYGIGAEIYKRADIAVVIVKAYEITVSKVSICEWDGILSYVENVIIKEYGLHDWND